MKVWTAVQLRQFLEEIDDHRLASAFFLAGCAADDVEEIRSLGKTLSSWRTEIIAHHRTGASNGPTEGLNLAVKKVKRCGHGFRSFENYRLRIRWPEGATAPPLRCRSPHLDA